MNVKNNYHLLAIGLRNRLTRLIERHNVHEWGSYTLPKMVELQWWLREAEMAGRKK